MPLPSKKQIFIDAIWSFHMLNYIENAYFDFLSCLLYIVPEYNSPWETTLVIAHTPKACTDKACACSVQCTNYFASKSNASIMWEENNSWIIRSHDFSHWSRKSLRFLANCNMSSFQFNLSKNGFLFWLNSLASVLQIFISMCDWRVVDFTVVYGYKCKCCFPAIRFHQTFSDF